MKRNYCDIWHKSSREKENLLTGLEPHRPMNAKLRRKIGEGMLVWSTAWKPVETSTRYARSPLKTTASVTIRLSCLLYGGKKRCLMATRLMSVTHLLEIGANNWYKETVTGFWRVYHAIWYRIFPVSVSGNE